MPLCKFQGNKHKDNIPPKIFPFLCATFDNISEAVTKATSEHLEERYVRLIVDIYKQVFKNVTENLPSLYLKLQESQEKVKNSLEKAKTSLISKEECEKIIDGLEEILQKAMELDTSREREHRLPYRPIK